MRTIIIRSDPDPPFPCPRIGSRFFLLLKSRIRFLPISYNTRTVEAFIQKALGKNGGKKRNKCHPIETNAILFEQIASFVSQDRSHHLHKNKK